MEGARVSTTVEPDSRRTELAATIARPELIEAARRVAVLNRAQAQDVVETFLALIGDSLACGEPVLLSGFGKFEIKKRRARKARNIKAGLEILLPERTVVVFKPSRLLTDRLNPAAGGRTRAKGAAATRRAEARFSR